MATVLDLDFAVAPTHADREAEAKMTAHGVGYCVKCPGWVVAGTMADVLAAQHAHRAEAHGLAAPRKSRAARDAARLAASRADKVAEYRRAAQVVAEALPATRVEVLAALQEAGIRPRCIDVLPRMMMQGLVTEALLADRTAAILSLAEDA